MTFGPSRASRCRRLAPRLALVLFGTGALLLAAAAAARAWPFFGAERRRPIIQGKRPFEKSYTRRIAKDAWQTISTGIDDDLNGVWAVDRTHAWVSGVSGGLYRTRDAGATWEPLVGVDAAAYAQIAWANSEQGYAVTRGGALARSEDGGATWKVLDLPRRAAVRRIAFASGLEGWVAGDRGLLLHTRDGGTTWEDQNPEGGGDLTDLQMLSAKVLWAGGKGTLLRTEDGGAHWTSVRALDLWTFVSGRRGYASDGRSIFGTEDGGRTWTPGGSLPTGTQGEGLDQGGADEEGGSALPGAGGERIVRIQFVDRYNGIAETLLGNRQVIFGTQRLGRFWKRVYDARRGSPEELVAITMRNGTLGWAIDAGGNLRVTTDGGRTWPVQVEARSFDLADVHFPDARHGWAVGLAGEVLGTDDGGASWHEAPRRVSTPLRRVRAVRTAGGETRVWAAGADGVIIASRLTGKPWQSPWRVQQTRTRRDLRALAMRDDAHGIAAGDDGTLLRTEDGGATWVPRRIGEGASLRGAAFAGPGRILLGGEAALLGSRDSGSTFGPEPVAPRDLIGTIADVAAPDPDHLFAITQEGKLLRSRDGGARWESVPIGADARLERLVFVGARRGWALAKRPAGGAVIYVTVDGGDTWRERPLPAEEMRGLSFADVANGWAVGPQAILVSRDGGENWRRQAIGPARGVRAFAFLQDGGGWAAGDNGLVLRTVPAAPHSPKKDRENE